MWYLVGNSHAKNSHATFFPRGVRRPVRRRCSLEPARPHKAALAATKLPRSGVGPSSRSRSITTRSPRARCTSGSSEMWAAVRKETGGRVDDAGLPAQQQRHRAAIPAALKMLVAGEIQFFTLMGGVLGAVVPVAEIQQVPFAFQTAPHAHQAVDGALGAYIREEMAAKGHPPVPRRRIRQRDAADHARSRSRSSCPADLQGHADARPRRRRCSTTCSATLGCEPVTDQQHRHLRGAQVRQGRRAGESARARRRLQAVRGREVRQHDQPHVVGLQPDGAPAHVAAAPGRHPSRPSIGTSRGRFACSARIRKPPTAGCAPS